MSTDDPGFICCKPYGCSCMYKEEHMLETRLCVRSPNNPTWGAILYSCDIADGKSSRCTTKLDPLVSQAASSELSTKGDCAGQRMLARVKAGCTFLHWPNVARYTQHFQAR